MYIYIYILIYTYIHTYIQLLIVYTGFIVTILILEIWFGASMLRIDL